MIRRTLSALIVLTCVGSASAQPIDLLQTAPTLDIPPLGTVPQQQGVPGTVQPDTVQPGTGPAASGGTLQTPAQGGLGSTLPDPSLTIDPLANSAATGAIRLPPRRPPRPGNGEDLSITTLRGADLGSTPFLGLPEAAGPTHDLAGIIARLDNQLRYAQAGSTVAVAGFPVDVFIGRSVIQPNRFVCREVTVTTPPVESGWACLQVDGSWTLARRN